MVHPIKHLMVSACASLILVTTLVRPALGQSEPYRDPDVNGVTSASNVRTEAAAKKDGERTPFQARAFVTPTGEGFASSSLPIPAGKRLVIEHVSAIARNPEGLRMEINFFTHMDNDGDGVGGIEDITFHRIVLTDQGTFAGVAIASANHQMLVFADEQIGSEHYGVGVQARLNGATTAFTQAQVTFSGYLEDLPAVQ